MNTLSKSPAALLFFALVFAGCAAADDPSSGETLDLQKGETFKLYESRTTVASNFCDKHKLLTITKSTQTTLTVTTESKIAGTCDMAALPDKMEFTVKRTTQDSCGSLTYAGTGKSVAQGGTETNVPLTIVDHRKRTCRDQTARLDVTIGTGRSAVTLYAPQATPAPAVCKVGERTFAAGESYKDRCNTCTCGADRFVSCTQLACS